MPERRHDAGDEGRGDSPFGVVDMSGNVWEWTLTTQESKTNEPDGDAARIIKGGGWFFFTKADLRATFSYYDLPFGAYNFRGFRVVRAE